MDYRASFGAALDLLGESVRTVGAFLPGPDIQEAQNKLAAFRLFAFPDQVIRSKTDRMSLASMAALAQALPCWQRIFAMEGVAHYCTSVESNPRGLLADSAIPETSMVPMHAGMGTALAGAALSRLGETPSNTALNHMLEGFLESCDMNSRPGWLGNAIEPMGLVVRTLHPHLLTPISRQLGEIDPAMQRLFWHGVGRSLYFVPMNFVPAFGSHERSVRAAISEAPTVEDRHNAIAGLTWAVTLVNILHPGVLESFLRTCRPISGYGVTMSAAVTNGITSALMVWKHMVPENSQFLAPYLRNASPRTPYSQVWKDLVAEPAARAFEELFPTLTQPGALGNPTIASLFQYQDMRVGSL